MKTITVKDLQILKEEIKGVSPYDLIDSELLSSDEEDGGKETRYILQEQSTLQYFAFITNDWQSDTNFNADLDTVLEMQEVTRKERVEVYYE